MTLKEELEILRGEPIAVFDGDPMEMPCIETSDPKKLCKNPVVSVHMITYNHEPYIRQAIDGVMMQKTDFEFELVIGEDCSQDRTREICFEYQKKYPDKIRILWWHENVSKYGGNGRRVSAYCRGEFVAICEGDDCWLSPYKLQRQVDVLRKFSNVGVVATAGIVVDSNGKKISDFNPGREGFVARSELLDQALSNFWFGMLTCSLLYRREVLTEAFQKLYLLDRMRLKCGDIQKVLAILSTSDAYFLPENCVAYRRSPMSATGNPATNFKVGRDGLIARYAYAKLTDMVSCQERLLKQLASYMVESGAPFMPFGEWSAWRAKANVSWIEGIIAIYRSYKRLARYNLERHTNLLKGVR